MPEAAAVPRPADVLQQEDDTGLDQATRSEPHRNHREGERAPPVEPVHHGDGDRQERAEHRAEGDHQEREVERQDRVDLAQGDEPQREDHEAQHHHLAWPEAVDGPALDGTEQPTLDALQGEGEGEGGAAPAKLILEQHDVCAEGVEDERAR